MPKLLAIVVDGPKKKFLNEPNVASVIDIEMVIFLAPNEKSSPSACELGPNLNPQAFDPTISGRSIVLTSRRDDYRFVM